jgi:hypothetical protein
MLYVVSDFGLLSLEQHTHQTPFDHKTDGKKVACVIMKLLLEARRN